MTSHDEVLKQERIEALQAMVTAIGRRSELFSALDGVTDPASTAAATALQSAFGFNPLQANAVLALQVRSFGPQKLELLERELRELQSD